MLKVRLRSESSLMLRGAGIVALSGTNLTAATALTVSDFANQQIIQRVGTSKTVTVSGTYTGPASVVQARAVPHGTALSNPGYAWTTVATNPVGGTYSGSLTVPQGGWYNIQVRDGVNNAISASGTNKWGVGIIVALLGQSNMEHLRSSPLSYPLGSPLVCDFDGSAWDRIGNINDAWPVNTPWPTYGSYTRDTGAWVADGMVYFANYLQSALGIPVGTLAYAVTGSAIASWQPSGGANWTAFASAATGAGGDYEAAIWLQGESDAGSSMATYKTLLANLHNGILSATGRASSDFHFGVVTLGQGTTGWTAEGNMGPVRQAQLEYIASASGSYYAGNPLDFSLLDSIHIDATGLAKLGKRYAEGLARRLEGNSNGVTGPTISSATRSGAVVTVNIQQHGGTSLLDGAGGSGSSLLGFRVFDNGTPATISSTAIAGNTVTLTLSATPAGTVTLDYGMANLPFGSTVTPASALYDNQSIAGLTGGLPADAIVLLEVRTDNGPILPCDRGALDSFAPTWQLKPTDSKVKNFMYAPVEHPTFWVYPAQNTTPATVELVYSAYPSQATQGSTLDVQDKYSSKLVDYVLYRALSKDAEVGSAERALAYYQSFNA